eukprot:6132101-Pyramimonas_sp.AAC.1
MERNPRAAVRWAEEHLNFALALKPPLPVAPVPIPHLAPTLFTSQDRPAPATRLLQSGEDEAAHNAVPAPPALQSVGRTAA